MKPTTIPITGRRSMYSGFAASASSDVHVEHSETDIDSRATHLLEEIHRVRHNFNYGDNDLVESNMLQKVEQTFEAEDYLRALESGVDRLLRSQAMTKRHRSSTGDVNYLESQNDKHCRACNSSPCKWSPHCDADALAKRRKALFKEIKSVDDRRKRQISEEIQVISAKLKLTLVDKELHDAYAANDNETIT
eukprot:scaffold12205_cov115-Skeletonema_dohrnii-CCMP3373.AAC.1